MTKNEIWETMLESEFHNAKIETVDGRIITGYVDLHESEYDSGENEPYIGVDIKELHKTKNATVKPENLWDNGIYASEIKSIEILDKVEKED